KGKYVLSVHMVGYAPYRSEVNLTDEDVSLTVYLTPGIHMLKEVVVHDKTSLKKDEYPLNTDIVSSQFVHRYLGGSLMQTLGRLPGVSMIGIGSGQSKALIRGMGFNRVVTVEKGIKHEGQQWGADHGLEIDQFATGDIEVIRGGASFMYGSDAIGGV